jgi:hypothetical protein
VLRCAAVCCGVLPTVGSFWRLSLPSHAYIHAYIRTYISTYTYTYTHTHTHTHTLALCAAATAANYRHGMLTRYLFFPGLQIYIKIHGKLIEYLLVIKFPLFHSSEKFITGFLRIRHRIFSYFQSVYHTFIIKSTLVLSYIQSKSSQLYYSN